MGFYLNKICCTYTHAIMHCRAALLLDKEIEYLQLFPLYNILVNKVPDPFVCLAKISGLKGTVWEGGVFHLTIRISEHYNEELPEIHFNTIPFHPNVDPETGRLCLEFDDILTDITLNNILLLAQNVLSNPVLAGAINVNSARLLSKKPQDYEKLVKKCIQESKNVVGMLTSDEFVSDSAYNQKKFKPYLQSNPVAPTRAKQISFDVYHRTWAQVATTKPLSTVSDNDSDGNILLKLWDNGSRPTSATSLQQHRTALAAGLNKPFHSKQKTIERVSAMKKLYLNKSTENVGTDAADDIKDEAYLSDNEANELVKWTSNLDEEKI